MNANFGTPMPAHMFAGSPREAYVAALAGLPHLTPGRLRRLLSGGEPADVWSLVRAGRVLAGPEESGDTRSAGSTGGCGAETARQSSCSGSQGPELASRRGNPEGICPDGWGSGGLMGVGGPEGPGAESGTRAGGGNPGSRWTPDALARAWRAHAERTDPGEVLESYRAAGVRICMHGGAGYPPALREDPEAPPVLFCLGDLTSLEHPTVAVVGTRACTHYGEEVAAELGSALARAGVSVLSGLALGIDGAAHRGALAGGGAPTLAIVGSGLDVVYPSRHVRLWHQIATAGGLVSEAPLGAGAEAWRFPWRNRLIAALADVVVVVESHRAGGALLTVEAAIRRGVAVLAVPGSIRSPASAGTNALIADGCPPVRDVEDVLVALGLSTCRSRMHGGEHPGRSDRTPDLGGPETPCAVVWSALEAEPTPTDVILRRTGLTLGVVAAALDQLEEEGWARAGDGWWERTSRGPG